MSASASVSCPLTPPPSRGSQTPRPYNVFAPLVWTSNMDEKGKMESTLIILEQNQMLRVFLSLAAGITPPLVFCCHNNYSFQDEDAGVERIKCVQREGRWSFDLSGQVPGPLYFRVRFPSGKESETHTLLINPRLILSDRGLPLDQLCCQSHITRCLGPLKEWRARMELSLKCGYNAFHLTPIQAIGQSGSAYSIENHLIMSPSFFDGEDAKLSEEEKISRVKGVLDDMRCEYAVAFVVDLVWNHTAASSAWLREHPEAGYNLVNSPHLIPAYELDKCIMKFSADLADGKYSSFGLSPPLTPAESSTADKIEKVLKEKAIPEGKFWEYYILDVKTTMLNFENLLKEDAEKGVESEAFTYPVSRNELDALLIERRPFGERFPLRLRFETAKRAFSPSSQGGSISAACTALARYLDEVNLQGYHDYDSDISCVVTSVIGTAKYEFGAVTGQHFGQFVSSVEGKHPLVWSYFTVEGNGEDKERVWANNGFIWGGDPSIDHATNVCKAYMRRELVVWGDCVKLRYGKCEEDSPFLWDYMKKYTRLCASMFEGVRLDNCHGTPMHVAEVLVREARSVRSNLIVIAELFTNSAQLDEIFVKRLGLNLLVREAMQCDSPSDLSRLVLRWGCSRPVGSLLGAHGGSEWKVAHNFLPKAIFMDCSHDNETPAQKRTACDALATAVVVGMSCCPMGTTRGYDELVPSTVNVAKEKRRYYAAGIDFPPFSGTGLYPPPLAAALAQTGDSEIDSVPNIGLSRLRAALNRLREDLTDYTELYCEEFDGVMTITRHNPSTHDRVIACIRTAFKGSGADVRSSSNAAAILDATLSSLSSPPAPFSQLSSGSPLYAGVSPPAMLRQAAAVASARVGASMGGGWDNQILPGISSPGVSGGINLGGLSASSASVSSGSYSAGVAVAAGNYVIGKKAPRYTLRFPGALVGCHLAAQIDVVGPDEFLSDDNYINGLRSVLRLAIDTDEIPDWMGKLTSVKPEGETVINLDGLSYGACVIVRCSLWPQEAKAAQALQAGFGICKTPPSTISPDKIGGDLDALQLAVSTCSFSDLNLVLYRCEEEEQAMTKHGAYHLNDEGLVYCGLAGFMSKLNQIRVDPIAFAGHPLLDNLRRGDWAMDYTTGRLSARRSGSPSVAALMDVLDSQFARVSRLPRFIVPFYFDLVISAAYGVATSHALGRMTLRSENVDELGDSLRLVSLQVLGRSFAPLLSADVQNCPPAGSAGVGCAVDSNSMAAGLPHFSTGFMRCWGRDTFISLRGVAMLTRRWDDARNHILAFAAVCRNGLIPNLMNSGHPRYNARDATWFFLESVQKYCEESPEGYAILSVPVPRVGAGPEVPSLASLSSLSAFSSGSLGKMHVRRASPRERSNSGGGGGSGGNSLSNSYDGSGGGLAALDMPPFSSSSGFAISGGFFGPDSEVGTGIGAIGEGIESPNTHRGTGGSQLSIHIGGSATSLFSPGKGSSSESGSVLGTPKGANSGSNSNKPLIGMAATAAARFRDMSVDCGEPEDPDIRSSHSHHHNGPRKERTLLDVIQGIMQSHAAGIDFVEAGAGPSLDGHMKSEGFRVQAHVDWTTGFVHGGSHFNCGTWMDKMGSSEAAGNNGVPATPRDGADIEIVGLCKSATRWLSKIHERGISSYDGVTIPRRMGKPAHVITYAEWDDLIQRNFHRLFWVPDTSSLDADYHVDTRLVTVRNIYRDVVGSTNPGEQYRLRPNLCIAMVVAPELFPRESAQICLDIVERRLMGRIGMKTLDEADVSFRGHYDNTNQSNDYFTAHGFNYHQGPEWVWPTGYFLRALMTHMDASVELVDRCLAILARLHSEVMNSPWAGLPELTQSGGWYCQASCPTQAWSAACALEALVELRALQKIVGGQNRSN